MVAVESSGSIPHTRQMHQWLHRLQYPMLLLQWIIRMIFAIGIVNAAIGSTTIN